MLELTNWQIKSLLIDLKTNKQRWKIQHYENEPVLWCNDFCLLLQLLLFLQIIFLLSDNSELVDGTLLKSALSIDMNGLPIDLVNYWMVVRTPQLSITKTVAKVGTKSIFFFYVMILPMKKWWSEMIVAI